MKRADLEQKLYASKQMYTQTPIPTELTERMHQTLQTHALPNQKPNTAEIEQNQDEKEKMRSERRKVIRMKQWNWKKTTGIVAACAVLAFTAGLNISPTFAEDMQNNAVIGEISKVLTFRSYDFADADKQISADIPQVEAEGNGYTKDINEEILRIVADYEAQANADIAAYKEAFLATGGTEEEFEAKNIQVDVDYEVKSENDSYLSLVLTAYENWSNAYTVQYFYNINLKDDTEITLKDLLGEDYIQIANEQIQAQIAADDSGLYFDQAMGGFTTITNDTNFYINAEGNPVIVFAQYEIAAGAAGSPEFEIVCP